VAAVWGRWDGSVVSLFFSGVFFRRAVVAFGSRLFGGESFRGAAGLRFRAWRFRSSSSPAILLLSRPSQVFLEGQAASSRVTVSNNRSVMPLDVLGRTRATLKESACFTLPVRKDRVTAEPPSWLGLGTAMIPMNQESLVGAGH
jgi:hypothetical protein